MLKIKVSKFVRPLDLGEYVPELAGQTISVWVNPPREKVLAYGDILKAIDGFGVEISRLEARMKAEPENAVDIVEEINAMTKRIKKANDSLFAWYAEIWSQGDEEESIESVREFATSTMDTDPALWRWVAQSTVLMISAHRAGAKKG